MSRRLAIVLTGIVTALAGCGDDGGGGGGDPDATVVPPLPVGATDLWLTDAVADADGRVVAVGTVGTRGEMDVAVVRFVASGAPDPAFGTGGVATADLGSAVDQAYGVAIDGQGRTIVVGETSRDGTPDVAVLRLLADGTLDPSFGTAGVVVLALSTWGPKIDRATAIDLDAGGNLVIAVVIDRDQGAREDFGVLRLLETGARDPSFGANGLAGIAGTGDEYASFVRVTGDGHIVIGGASNGSVSVARVDATGALDPAFGTAGVVKSSLAAGFQRIAKAAQDTQGRWVLVGDAVQASASGGRSDLLVLRYSPDGALDTTFGAGTGFRIVTTGGDAMGRGIVVEPDGHVMVAGQSHDGWRWTTVLARLLDDGTPDAAFGTAGSLQHGFGAGSHEVAALVSTPGGLALAASVDGAPFLAGLGQPPALSLSSVDVPARVPFEPVPAGAPDRPLVEHQLFASSGTSPLTGNLITLTGAIGPVRGTPTAVFLHGNVVRFTAGAVVFADGEDGQAPRGANPGVGGEGGSGGGGGAAGHSGYAGIGGSFGRDGNGASGGSGGRGWAAQYASTWRWGTGGAGGIGNGCCPPIVPAGHGSNGAGGGGGGAWTNIYTPGGGGGGGLIVVVADRIEGPGKLSAHGGNGRSDTNGGKSGGGGGGVVWVAAGAYDGQLQVDVTGGRTTVNEPGRAGTAQIFQLLPDGTLVARTFADVW